MPILHTIHTQQQQQQQVRRGKEIVWLNVSHGKMNEPKLESFQRMFFLNIRLFFSSSLHLPQSACHQFCVLLRSPVAKWIFFLSLFNFFSVPFPIQFISRWFSPVCVTISHVGHFLWPIYEIRLDLLVNLRSLQLLPIISRA